MGRIVTGVAVCVLAQAAWAVDAVGLSVGQVSRPHWQGELDDLRVALGWTLPWRWLDDDTGALVTRAELEAGRHDTETGRVWSVSALPVLHYRFKTVRAGWGPFVEAGLGLAWLSETVWAPGYDLSSRWQFASRLGVGYAFGAHELSAEARHFSNGGLKHPNPGADMFALRYRWLL
ncbi:lipid A 3-O-deacylase [Crenobacter luteus]|uniref:Acyloxyacyl hydrolase n=1 Tax=Crenobacter luteus TaxID=1452487 RepID=A0A161SDQ0_9NEIS|nr:acyloxyacyl hydrolase [Crenobacter luteus]KZE34483.1 hypothetical protein AVW16_06300 [Crenobacter luteus]TCP11347.1 lipid A 3-O-deacylase [Crenobacter luteus]